jgi:hypothetical protein
VSLVGEGTVFSDVSLGLAQLSFVRGSGSLGNVSDDDIIAVVLTRGLAPLFGLRSSSTADAGSPPLDPATDSTPPAAASFAVATPESVATAPLTTKAGTLTADPFQAALNRALVALDPSDDASCDATLTTLTRLHVQHHRSLLRAVYASCFSGLRTDDELILLLDWLALLNDPRSRTERGHLLLAFLGDSSPDVRLAALSGLEWLRFAPAGALLRKSAQEERIPSLRKAMSEAALTVEG